MCWQKKLFIDIYMFINQTSIYFIMLENIIIINHKTLVVTRVEVDSQVLPGTVRLIQVPIGNVINNINDLNI